MQAWLIVTGISNTYGFCLGTRRMEIDVNRRNIFEIHPIKYDLLPLVHH